MSSIRTVEIQAPRGEIEKVQIDFGEHHFLELEANGGKVTLRLGQTHHGFSADASEVNGELEQMINLIRREYPKKSF